MTEYRVKITSKFWITDKCLSTEHLLVLIPCIAKLSNSYAGNDLEGKMRAILRYVELLQE